MAGDDSTKPDDGHEGEGLPGSHVETEGFPDQENAQLALDDGGPGLPWLEGDDDDDEYYEGYHTGRLIGIALLGLLVLGAVAGGIWWITYKMGAHGPVPDGSIVHAPAKPYKMQPENPGGRPVAGTGDTSFAVAEGQTRPARLEGAAPSPTPESEKRVKADKGGTGQGAASADAADTGGVGVQVAAYSNKASAEAGWNTLSQQYEALSGLHHRVVVGQADIGTVYRLQAVTGDVAAAKALCRQLRSEGLNCQVKN